MEFVDIQYLEDNQLAIEMWEYIRKKIEEFDPATVTSENVKTVTDWKAEFLKLHGKGVHYWYNMCLLCQRYIDERAKCKCPLSERGKDCGKGSTWEAVCSYYKDKARALKGVEKIIKVMKEEAEKYERKTGKEKR